VNPKGPTELMDVSPLVKAQFTGFFQDLIYAITDLDITDEADDVEDLLYRHAKFPCVDFKQALDLLGKVEALVFKFTFKAEISRSKYERESSPVLKLLRKSEGKIMIPY